ncbi:Dehydrogenase patE [Lachnellula cervina]|uniref:Dehydrogenase patE n=1 Tax=Lachnellula cervina TaxID=1316786 RepID=A0A7D8YPQ2_9HELO|nr:Dehydrogenase patE [Lachnellula cervina]
MAKFTLFFVAAIASFISASTTTRAKRQLDGPLAGLEGDLATDQEFDYIVVGGGTGGLTIATRLAEDTNVTVAVIEAGLLYSITDPLEVLPGGDVTFVGTTESLPTVDWGFFTTPDPASESKRRSYARGKCLGGSSARNFMIYQRPTVQALNRWADEVDDQSWSFDNFLPYYEKSPKFTPPGDKRASNATALYTDSAFLPTGGPLKVSYPNFAQPFSSYMQGALNEIGIPTIQDFNSGSLLGCQYCSTTINPDTAQRDSSQTSFLNAAANHSNLNVFSGTMGKSIVFDSNKKATGVVVESLGISYTLQANKEVIISAGPFQSPQLLMVSGVGPSDQLAQLDISVVSDLAGVGQGMQDHIFFGPAYRVNMLTFTELANNPLYLAAEVAVWAANQSGPLANPVADFLGWEKVPDDHRSSFDSSTLSDLSTLPDDWPEVEYLSGAGYVGNWSSLLFDQPKDGYQYATILAALVAPFSRGNITLTSSDTNDLPIINTAYLESTTDQQVAIAAYKRMREAWNSTYMQQVVIGDEYFPGLAVESDEEILSTIKGSLQTVWHASCTCKMGNSSDAMAVVDSHARVYGVQGVRVVDASAFPFLPPGHPQSSVFRLNAFTDFTAIDALAEKVADLIKNGE